MEGTAQQAPAPSRVEQSLRSALCAAEAIPPDLEWFQLSGGRSNRIWRIGEGENALICKLYDSGKATRLFPNDPDAEFQTLRFLSGTGLAPEPVELLQTAVGTCLLYRFVPGTLWKSDAALVGRTLARLHRIDPPPNLRRIAGGFRVLRSQGQNMLADCLGKEAQHLRAQMPSPVETRPGREVFLHGDAVPGNLVVHGDRLTLIDWQCPAIGDPCEDLAIFLSPAMQLLYANGPLSPAQKDSFLRAYGNQEVSRRLAELQPWFHWRMATHCLRKSQKGDAAYADAFRVELAALKAL